LVPFRAVLREHHREVAENLVLDRLGVPHPAVRHRALEISLGALEELWHQHPRDTVLAAAEGIAEEMNETFRRQEIAGLRICLARAPGEGGPILGERDVDLPFYTRRAG